MNSETYQELFHYVSFPVFATSKNGRMLYKNLACSKYLPEIYGSTGVKSKIYPEFPQKSKPVRLWGGSAYSVALAMMDGENVVFLGFSRFQCADGIYMAEKILETCGDNLFDVLVGLRQMIGSRKYTMLSPNFDDEEVVSFAQTELGWWKPQKSSLPSVFRPVFERLNESFKMLGYSFSSEIESDFPEYLPVPIPINDLLFLLGKLVYLTMKFSCTCQIKAVLFSEIAYSRHRLRVETQTNLKNLPQTEGNLILMMNALIPECAVEINLLNQIGFMKNSDFSIHLDALGTLSVTYNFPYQEPDWGCVQSVEDFSLPMLDYIENMINSIMIKMKDNLSLIEAE